MAKTAVSDRDPRSPIPSVDFSGAGSPLHFLHANGYPPACYTPLLKRLATEYHVFGMLLRPLWPGADPATIRDWQPFSEDLRRFLHEKAVGRVIGMGHSIGATVTLRAALREPGLFRALILMDPVLMPPGRMLQLRLVRALGLPHPLERRMAGALGRRREFDDLEQLFAGYRRRSIFRYFSDEHLRTLVQGLTRRGADGRYELVYSPAWEARIYQTGVWNDWDVWSGLDKLSVPALIIRGAETDTFWEGTARLVVRRNPGIKIVTVPASTHLVPLERPEEVTAATRNFVEPLGREGSLRKG